MNWILMLWLIFLKKTNSPLLSFFLMQQVVAKRWRIDLQSRQEAHLLLSAVSLPGGVQRRRTQEDELNMRSVFKEGDLVSVRTTF